MSTMDDWEQSRDDAIVDRLDPTGERREQLDPQWDEANNDGSVMGNWEKERHDLNLEHDLGDGAV
jgi:hypothetical protein